MCGQTRAQVWDEALFHRVSQVCMMCAAWLLLSPIRESLSEASFGRIVLPEQIDRIWDK